MKLDTCCAILGSDAHNLQTLNVEVTLCNHSTIPAKDCWVEGFSFVLSMNAALIVMAPSHLVITM